MILKLIVLTARTRLTEERFLHIMNTNNDDDNGLCL